jgi:hypothetical protein
MSEAGTVCLLGIRLSTLGKADQVQYLESALSSGISKILHPSLRGLPSRDTLREGSILCCFVVVLALPCALAVGTTVRISCWHYRAH